MLFLNHTQFTTPLPTVLTIVPLYSYRSSKKILSNQSDQSVKVKRQQQTRHFSAEIDCSIQIQRKKTKKMLILYNDVGLFTFFSYARVLFFACILQITIFLLSILPPDRFHTHSLTQSVSQQ